MFGHRNRIEPDRKTLCGAFMKKFFLCTTLIALVLTFSFPTFAAKKDGFSYSGNSYWGTVKYGLNLRDKDGDIICCIKSGAYVYVLGISKDDASRVVVEYGDTVGTVLKVGVKKSSTGSHQSNARLTYSGKSYYGKVKYCLNVRDEKNNIIGKITKDKVVHVLGVYNKDSSRVVIEWGNSKGTVLKVGLAEICYSGKSYYAVTRNVLNMRDTNGNIICKIPKNSLVYVKGAYTKNKTRVMVQYNGTEGTILKYSTKEIKDAIFVNIPTQKTTLIRNNKIIAESKCVTGLKNVNDTPRGAFKITKMKKNATLRGRNNDGSWYVQPVNYWIPFYGAYGLHDASWRSSFGGKIYQNNGSHGCVNLPYKFVKTLYKNAYVGMPVYIS